MEEFKKAGKKDDQDSRLLGVCTDNSGKRRLELYGLLLETMTDFPLGGEVRAVKEFLEAIVEGPGSLARYHTDWARLSGIADGSSINHEAVTKKFTEHLTNLLKARATIWKQERLYQEELRHQAAASSRGDKGDGKGKGPPRRRERRVGRAALQWGRNGGSFRTAPKIACAS